MKEHHIEYFWIKSNGWYIWKIENGSTFRMRCETNDARIFFWEKIKPYPTIPGFATMASLEEVVGSLKHIPEALELVLRDI